MDTFVARLQKSFGKLTYAVAIGVVVVTILHIIQLHFDGAYGLTGQFELLNSQTRWFDARRYGGSRARPKQNIFFRFNADADLTPLFNWNTKQVFAYITLDYNTTNEKTGVVNENSIVVWDRIITDKNAANLSLTRMSTKYQAWDLKQKFLPNDEEVEFNLHWNVQPRVGLLYYGKVDLEGNRKKIRTQSNEGQVYNSE